MFLQVLCDLSFLKRRIAAGLLDLHIDDCQRALRCFTVIADHANLKGGKGDIDFEWKAKIQELSSRLQEMSDFLVSDRALLLSMPGLVAQQAANRPAGSAPEIAGLFALDRFAGQIRANVMSERAREAMVIDRDIRNALARYRPPSALTLSAIDTHTSVSILGEQVSDAFLPSLELNSEGSVDVLEPPSNPVGRNGMTEGGDSITFGNVESQRQVEDRKSGLSPPLVIRSFSAETSDRYLVKPLSEGLHFAGQDVLAGDSMQKFDEAAKISSGIEIKPLFEDQKSHSDPPLPWIEHVNKEATTNASRRHAHVNDVAWNGSVASTPGTSFTHVALSPDEVQTLVFC